MKESSKATIEFCLDFIKSNVDTTSQQNMCRTWISTAIKTLKEENIGSADFAISELEQIDDYFSGKNASMTSVDVITKVDTVTQLI